MKTFTIADRMVGSNHPTYFIADIGANHDGSIERALALIRLAKEAGADAAKFQNFRAANIVSREGFEDLGTKLSHQAKWSKSVFEVYQDASIPFDWTPILKQECDRVGIHYFSSPYDFEAIDMLAPYVPAYKVGSGDIDWLEAIERMAQKGFPVLLATGAATIADVERAMNALTPLTSDICLMQCNTNYTGSLDNFEHLHLNVLKTFSVMYPDVVLGLSDHTPGHSAVLGAIALGARIIEKHFTDDNDRSGPDHPFALNPAAWREMVERTRELEVALGSSQKFVAKNEEATQFVQRRCVRASRDLKAGESIETDALEVLRPFVAGALRPYDLQNVIGKRTAKMIKKGAPVSWFDIID